MDSISKSLLKGAQEALEYCEGQKTSSNTHKVQVPAEVNVREIRQNLQMTRREFSEYFGFNIRTLEKWEQGVRRPDGTARAYLVVIAHNPEAVEKALGLRG